jgi:hypothetical protein
MTMCGLIPAVWIKAAAQNCQNPSMYNLYKNSKVCLAYIADVHCDATLDERAANEAECLEKYPNFQMSRWFTRGWTLQELIAPTNVIFYDSE